MNDLPEEVWNALVALQLACENAGIPLKGATIIGTTGITRYSTQVGSFEVCCGSADDERKRREAKP